MAQSIRESHFSNQDWHCDDFGLRIPVISENILAEMCHLYPRTRLLMSVLVVLVLVVLVLVFFYFGGGVGVDGAGIGAVWCCFGVVLVLLLCCWWCCLVLFFGVWC